MKHIYAFILTTFFSLNIFAQQAYYNDVDLTLTGLALKEELATKIISTHSNTLSYGWGSVQATDVNPDDSSSIFLIYGWESGSDSDCTNDLERGINENGGSSCEFNREHVYAKGLATPGMTNSGPGADAHHLRASDVQRNNTRGSLPFANGSGNSGKVNTNQNWYPGDEWKGDVARIIMYMYLRYGEQCLPSNAGVGSTANTPDEMIDLFLEWNAEDPVVDGGIEDQRNDYVQNASNTYGQGNRNPFIDDPYLATLIWGGNAAEDRWGTLSTTDFEITNIKIYPNPANNLLHIDLNTQAETAIEIYSLLGQRVMSITTSHSETLNIQDLNSGVYILKLTQGTKTISKKLIKN